MKTNIDLAALPAPLREVANARWERFVAAGAPTALQESLLAAGGKSVFAASEFVAESCVRTPSLFDSAFLQELQAASGQGAIRARVRHDVAGVPAHPALKAALRQARRREMVRIAWRDIAGWATLDQTLRELSDLADACIDAALARLAAWKVERDGAVRDDAGTPQSLVVLGFGKLGARELNFSSDVDLVFAWPAGGRSDGPDAVAADEWFTGLGRDLIQTLNEATSDGFVYRVDMRLRPFGASGPLALSFNALEAYYQSHGRDWERYALIKARPVAGDRAAGETLLRDLRPFIYRRYLDYHAFEALREMKAMIALEVARRGLEDNIKLGRGGIREIEFIGQVFQLIRGGREKRLRERSIRSVLVSLADGGYLEPHTASALDSAYVFLRRTENRLQMAADRQTHELPVDAVARLRLAWSMGHDHWAAFHATLEAHRDRVRAVFEAVFAAPDGDPRESESGAIWGMLASDDDPAPMLQELGFGNTALQALRDLHASRVVQSLGARGRRRLDELMPRLIRAATVSGKPDAVLLRLLRLVEAVAGRTAYLALLAENNNVLRHLAALAAASPWLLGLVTRVPLLMDELIDPRLFDEPPSRKALSAELDTVLADLDPTDQEAEMDALRQFQQAAVLRIAAADLSGYADAPLIGRRLSALAEVVIAAVADLTCRHLVARHGRPVGDGGEQPRMAVIAYGTLGGGELGYGSDLDLVFIHETASAGARTDGARPVDNTIFYARWSQRMISFLSTATSAGVLYRVDTRLRPGGSAGLLVGGFDGFAHYQRDKAWTWEHQALVRARPIAGAPGLGARFEQLRRELLCRRRELAVLKTDVAQMRERMRREIGIRTQAGFDIKQGEGGMVDIEFLAQYWVLACAHAHPELAKPRDIPGILGQLAALNCVDADVCTVLEATYHDYLERARRLKLEGWGAVVDASEYPERRNRVRSLWKETFSTAG